MTSQVQGVGAVTLFVEDLAAARRFYAESFELPVHYEDADSCVFAFGTTLVNLLDVKEAPSLVGPAAVADPAAGVRCQFAVEVDDVDAWCARLAGKGVALLNGPMDRPWGIRTASVRDPAGHIWEFAH